MIEAKLYTHEDEKDWNDFLLSSKNAVFFHHRHYLSYHIDRFDEKSLLLIKKNKIIALFPATANENIIVSHGGLTFAGLLTNKEIKISEVLIVFELIKQFYAALGFKKIIYKAIPYIFHQYPAGEDLYALFRNDAKLVRRDISTCLYLPERIRFSETKRQMVRKCEAKNLQVYSQTIFAPFWELLNLVVARHGAQPTHTVEEISLLHERFPSHIKLFEAKQGDHLLAGALIFDFGHTVHTQYMANSEEGREFGALDYLIHHLINNHFTNKQFFNFGISTEDQGRYLNEGLVLQKELMGGRAIAYDFYEISL